MQNMPFVLQIRKSPLIIFAVTSGHSLTGLSTKIAKATSLQVQPKSFISEEICMFGAIHSSQ